MSLVASPSVFVHVACSGPKEARSLAQALLNEGCALCISVIEGVESHYRFQGKLCREREALLWIKTRGDLAERAVALLRARHSYGLPAISVMRVEAVPADVAAWIESMGEEGEGEEQKERQDPDNKTGDKS